MDEITQTGGIMVDVSKCEMMQKFKQEMYDQDTYHYRGKTER